MMKPSLLPLGVMFVTTLDVAGAFQNNLLNVVSRGQSPALASFQATQRRPFSFTVDSVANNGDDHDDHDDTHKDDDQNEHNPQISRRNLCNAAVAFTVALSANSAASNAYDKSFPDELSGSGDVNSKVMLGSRSNSQQRASAAAVIQEQRKNNIIDFNLKNDLFPSVVWGGALWLLSGSRSNPLATPLANVLYNEEDQPWLKDRNAGLFAPLPLTLLVLLGVVFVALGVVTQYLLLQLAEGDSAVCSQLAGVSLIGGATFELGRIASGEKSSTREDFDRDTTLQEEFQEFASKRLVPGGSCHRNDIVSAFRRFYGKYRDPESEQYPLTDLEIERLLRQWNKAQVGAEMTSAGFYYGIQINKDADVFVSQL